MNRSSYDLGRYTGMMKAAGPRGKAAKKKPPKPPKPSDGGGTLPSLNAQELKEIVAKIFKEEPKLSTGLPNIQPKKSKGVKQLFDWLLPYAMKLEPGPLDFTIGKSFKF